VPRVQEALTGRAGQCSTKCSNQADLHLHILDALADEYRQHDRVHLASRARQGNGQDQETEIS
jgi:hypothetical protein